MGDKLYITKFDSLTKSELNSYVNIDNSKICDYEQYFKLLKNKYAKILRNFDFSKLNPLL